jgi:hypothetical protein
MQDRGDSQPLKSQPSPQPTAGLGMRPGQRPSGMLLRPSLAQSATALPSATPADDEFCYQLHKAAMDEYITAIWGWDEEVQRPFHERAFNPHRWQIITDAQADIGMLDVDYHPGEIYLARIEIHPGYQGCCIGTRIISACGGSSGQGPGPGSRRAHGQLPRASALPAAWPDGSGQARRPRYQGHDAVHPSPEVAAGEIQPVPGGAVLRTALEQDAGTEKVHAHGHHASHLRGTGLGIVLPNRYPCQGDLLAAGMLCRVALGHARAELPDKATV